MKSYVISFETSLTDRSTLEATIKAYGTWAKLTTNTWVVATEETAPQIRDKILALLNTGDRLFVLRSGTEAAWMNVIATNDWLKKNL